ncbi:MAG TPA: (Fe-S)-binding protein [Solimonas sp.]|nr:(Fe-S)-binding protein [Solimonas sp.]
MPGQTTPPFPLADADLCVKCGLCLPHCPTYPLTQHEGDSPRGRIALMQALALGQLAATPKLEAHLDGCLGCRSCEAVCPAKVPYGRLIDAGRLALNQLRPARTRFARLLGWLLTRRDPRRVLGSLLWLYQASGLQALLRRSGLLGRGRLARLESLLPKLPPLPWSARSTGQAPQAKVALFTGCISDLADGGTLQAAAQLLQRLGIEFSVPPDQGCCGALHQHAGMREAATACAQHNAEAFAGFEAVLGTASGCTATLLDAPDLLPPPAGARLRAQVQDIHAFLARHWREDLALQPLPARVAVHAPCSQRFVVGAQDQVMALLHRIPGIELVELDRRGACCGAAGSYFLTEPEAADRLLEPKLQAAEQLQPDFIVSSNIGCTLHLAAGLRRRGLKAPPVLHPLELLARQLPDG